jgi:hypothetical protein
VRNLRLFIEALLGKWLWWYGVDREAFWRRLILGKYESLGGGWSTKVVNGPYGVSLWKNIRSERDKFFRFVTFQIGTGAQIKF